MYLLLKYSKCTLVLLDPCCWSNQSERDVRWFFPRRTKYKPHPQDITYCMNASSEVMLHSLHVKDPQPSWIFFTRDIYSLIKVIFENLLAGPLYLRGLRPQPIIAYRIIRLWLYLIKHSIHARIKNKFQYRSIQA
jgi:hypothetical protein